MPPVLFGISTRLLIWGAVIIAVILAVWAYGNSRYDDGKDDADAAWVAAGDKLEKQAKKAAGKASEASAERQAEYQDQLATEKEKIDEANDRGDSPFDVLFGP